MSKKKPKVYDLKFGNKLDFGDMASALLEEFQLNFITDRTKYIQLDYLQGQTVTAVAGKITMPSLTIGSINVSQQHNCYMLFDVNLDCRYVGIRDDNQIVTRLKNHLVEGNVGKSATQSNIEKVMNYYNSGNSTIYLLTFEVTPYYMVKAVESWIMNHYWRKISTVSGVNLCDWNDRD